MMKKWIGRLVPIVLLALLSMLVPAQVFASTNADVTVNATPEYISIAVNITDYDFAGVAPSTWTNTTTSHFGITNTSTVTTDNTIKVLASTWVGGNPWTHSDDGVPGSNIVALKSNKGGTWGTGDVIVAYTTPLVLASSQAAMTDWAFGLALGAPTEFSDGAQKGNCVRITATKV